MLAMLQFRTDDVEEAREKLAREFGSHSRVPEASGPLGFEFFAVGTRRVLVGTTAARLGSTVRGATSGPTLHVPVCTVARYRVGRRELQAADHAAVVLAPGHEYSVRVAAGSCIAMRVEASLLDEALDARAVGRSGRWAVDSFELRLATAPPIATLSGAIAAFSRLERLGAKGIAGGATHAIERHLAAWFADLVLEARGVRALPVAGERIAEDIDRWIRGHLADPITLELLAGVAGVGGRCLQKACVARFGCSPLELVASRRLAAARRRLVAGAPGVSVTQAAAECGLSHLGRFAGSYKRAFGESPSATLARAAARGGVHVRHRGGSARGSIGRTAPAKRAGRGAAL